MRFLSCSFWPLLAYISVQTSTTATLLIPNKGDKIQDTLSTREDTILNNIFTNVASDGNEADQPSADVKMEAMRANKLHLTHSKWLNQRLYSENEVHEIESLTAGLNSAGKFADSATYHPTVQTTIQLFRKAEEDPSPENLIGLSEAVKEGFRTVMKSLDPYNKENEEVIVQFMKLFGSIAQGKNKWTEKALVPYEEISGEFKILEDRMNVQKLESMSVRLAIARMQTVWKAAFPFMGKK